MFIFTFRMLFVQVDGEFFPFFQFVLQGQHQALDQGADSTKVQKKKKKKKNDDRETWFSKRWYLERANIKNANLHEKKAGSDRRNSWLLFELRTSLGNVHILKIKKDLVCNENLGWNS